MSPWEKIKRLLNGCVSLASYMKARLGEQTTWAGIVVAITGAAALASPYSYLVIGCGVIGVLVPQSGGNK